MTRFFRKFRLRLMSNSKFSKYLLYAIGEILLVVIGILIALSVNNANQRRIDQKALDAHLKSIVRNIERDMIKAEAINEKRYQQLIDVAYIQFNIMPRLRFPFLYREQKNKANYGKEDVDFASTTLLNMWKTDYLNANTDGYESLKNTAYLSKLQDKDIASLISDYYSLISEIELTEGSHIQQLKESQRQFNEAELEGLDTFLEPDFKIWGKIEDKFRPKFLKIMENRSVASSYLVPYELIMEYDNLIIMGKELIRMIDNNKQNFDETSLAALKGVYDKYENIGYPKMGIHGMSSAEYSILSAYSDPRKRPMSQIQKGFIEISFPAMDWGVIYFYVGQGSVELLNTKDFSGYRAMKLELKGKKGGEKIKIAIKDETNPTDGSEPKVELTLTNEWKMYEIPLSSFAPTNLEKLFMPMAIIFEKDPVTIYAKDVEYIY